jgi:hypothetical protein
MLGAATALSERGMFVDAEQNRQMNTMIPVVEGLRDSGTLATFGSVVVHLGTNGPISDETMSGFFSALAGAPKVLVLTVRADRSWTAGNNARIFALPNQFPNVELLDWGGLSNACPGACFYSDNIHLQPAGAQYYAQLVQDFLAT